MDEENKQYGSIQEAIENEDLVIKNNGIYKLLGESRSGIKTYGLLVGTKKGSHGRARAFLQNKPLLSPVTIEVDESNEDDTLSEEDLPPMITLEQIKSIIAENETVTGKTLEQFKQAIDEGEIVNYSLTELEMWEMYEEMKREMEDS